MRKGESFEFTKAPREVGNYVEETKKENSS
jgi:hypothetical protein